MCSSIIMTQEEFELIQCGNCNTWGHVVCFGFRTAQDKRIPKVSEKSDVLGLTRLVQCENS